MFEQDVFDLAGKHLETAHRDHVLDPVDDFEKAVLVHRGHIAGAQPGLALMLDENILRRVRTIPVALHDLRTMERQFARLAIRSEDARVLLVQQQDFGPMTN